MANHPFSLFFALNLLLIISTNGRIFQKSNLSDVSISDVKGKLVALQATGSFTGKTNADDVEGLFVLITKFPTLNESNPDPCISPRWSWIECNSDPKPRIIALNLSKKSLAGTIPVFSSMNALERIDFSRNYFLYGEIPSFLGTFSNLQELNVANNYFYGTIPDSVACNKKLKLRVAGNTGLRVSSNCTGTGNIVDATLTSPPTTYTPTTYTSNRPIEDINTQPNLGAILGPIGSVLLLISIAITICFRSKANTAAEIAERNAGTLPNNQTTNMPDEGTPTDSRPNDPIPDLK